MANTARAAIESIVARRFAIILSMAQKDDSVPVEYIKPSEFAERRSLSLRTVHRWLKLKIIKAEQPAGSKGKWLIPK